MERTNVVANNWLGTLTVSKDRRRLYVCMSAGMISLNLQADTFELMNGNKVLLGGVAVRAVREDDRGRLWIATSKGLSCFDGKELTTLTMSDGLPAEDVTSLELEDDGTVWVGTVHGLAHYNPVTNQVNCYFAASGLQGNEYSNGASCRDSGGRLYFAGNNGITYFLPANIKSQPMNFRPQIISITLNGREMTADNLSFAHNDNTFTIALSTMNFARAEALQYAYRTDNGTWTMLPQGSADLTLSHLAPGKYNFEVKATDGQAESEILQFQVVVRPPLYATWWAYTLYALLAVLVLVLYLRNRQRKEQARLRLQEFIHRHESDEQRLSDLQATVDAYTTQLRQNRQRDNIVSTIANEPAPATEEPADPSPDDRLLERVLHVVSNHITDPDLSVELIAQEVGISRSHLHRKMKELTSQTTVDLIRSIRLQRAARLLSEGKMSVSDVMYACGFSFASSFTTTFKKFYGVSPTEYMRTMNKS
jgi:AraC-like DNA-binding protein